RTSSIARRRLRRCNSTCRSRSRPTKSTTKSHCRSGGPRREPDVVKPGSVAIVGAAEMVSAGGMFPELSQLGLHSESAIRAMKETGLRPSDIDGVACAGASPTEIAWYLGITPTWADGTSVGGCSFMLHVRHAAAAIESGLCNTVLITHGESGRSGIGRGPW